MPDDASRADLAAQDERATLVEQLHAYVEHALTTGIDGFRRDGSAATADHAAAAIPRRVAAAAVAHRAEPEADTPSATPPGPESLASAGDLAAVRAVLGDCQRCKLCSGRTNIVFGVGNPAADLLFVGEGPGRDEDLKAEPFVGRAGQLLTDIITKGMKLRRDDVYIANVVKCRPPNNRDPEPDEIAACRPFLQRQIEIIRPKVIVALGRFAAQTMLDSRTPVSRLRGHWHDYHGIQLMPTLHPAYLLRNPADKRLVWEDIKQVMEVLGISR